MIKLNQLETIPNCTDSVGRVYFYKEKILRGINSNFVRDVNYFFESGLAAELMTEELIPRVNISHLKIEGYQLVIESEKIENWNYAYEWSFSMLKDAALTILKINTIAKKYGYQLKDPHQENITFRFNRPVYIDFGSIVKIDSHVWVGYREFLACFYTPLKLMQTSLDQTARAILKMESSLDENEVFVLLHPVLSKFSLLRSGFTFFASTIYRVSFLKAKPRQETTLP